MGTLVKGQPTEAEEVRAEALRILDRMREIADADMMLRGTYVTDTVIRPLRRGSACRGHKACAIGSLWLAADVKFRRGGDGTVALPGVDEGDQRRSFVRRRPPLKLALKALNEEAAAYIEKHEIGTAAYADPIEALFESSDPHMHGADRRRVMLKVIAAAKRRIKAAA